jgi:hypothetical protein
MSQLRPTTPTLRWQVSVMWTAAWYSALSHLSNHGRNWLFQQIWTHFFPISSTEFASWRKVNLAGPLEIRVRLAKLWVVATGQVNFLSRSDLQCSVPSIGLGKHNLSTAMPHPASLISLGHRQD